MRRRWEKIKIVEEGIKMKLMKLWKRRNKKGKGEG